MNKSEPTIYAVRHYDEDVRTLSRSGGIFTAISDYVLNNGGSVYGCVLSKELRAIHIRATKNSERDQMRESKYVQSDLKDIFRQIKEDLETGMLVLFSGTSCQVAGLRCYLNSSYEKLICLDILCHGVPSPKIWESYLKWQEKKHKQTIKAVQFRNKKVFGWAAHIESLYMMNGERVDDTTYTKLFYSLNIIRPSCFNCPYKSIDHPGDITIGDYWGIHQAVPEFDDDKGISLVFLNSKKGSDIFENIKNEIIFVQTEIEECMMQKPLIEPYEEPETRSQFWQDFNQKGFNYITKKYLGYGKINQIRAKLGIIKRKFLKWV